MLLVFQRLFSNKIFAALGNLPMESLASGIVYKIIVFKRSLILFTGIEDLEWLLRKLT